MEYSEIIKKIGKDILQRSIKKNFQLLPQMGESSNEFDYTYNKSNIQELKDHYIIVSKILQYHNSSLSDFNKNVYVYDENGNYMGGNEYKEKFPSFIKSLSALSS